jgi:NAD(P)-dependent dehydrogenase (short-subunit alcohol dehydrogenase family)
MEIEGRTFLVAGGGSGLGAATTEMLTKEGANAVVADLRGEAAGGNVRFVETDVTDEASVRRAIEEALQSFGGMHGAINCAGIASAEKVLGREGPHSLESFAKVVEVNLVGTFNVLRLAAEVMVNNEPAASGERGVIVNTASVAAYDGQIGQAAYSASKGGVVGMTLPIARDLSAVGIRVNTIAPGLIDTPIYGQGEGAEQFKERLKAGVLFPRRLGTAEEFGTLAVELVTNSYMNAETIRVDGGIRMQPK